MAEPKPTGGLYARTAYRTRPRRDDANGVNSRSKGAPRLHLAVTRGRRVFRSKQQRPELERLMQDAHPASLR